MRYMLVDGHGNFGSVDGDPPAAYRYTEARLSKISNEMLRDIDKETVDWDPNFDESRKEPRVLPSRFPNLLVNGSSGIAVGMATNIPPHNLTEVINGAICLMDNPDASLDDLMEHIKGPDFPTGGVILGRSGIREAYHTGRGRILVRAKSEVEELPNGRGRIVITEIPYGVNKAKLVEKIAELVHEKQLEGISDIRDESDRHGMRIVIDLKRDVQPQVVLNFLYKHTQLQDTFGVIMLALVHGEPKILSLREMLYWYIEHQKDVVTRRTKYDLDKSLARAHILEGLLKAMDNIDEIVHIIRHSKDTPTAKQELMDRFEFSDKQAQAILDMRLARLTNLEADKLLAEYQELEKTIAYLQSILADEKLLMSVIKPGRRDRRGRPDPRGRYGGHSDPLRLRQAPAPQHLSRPGPRRQGRGGSEPAGRGLHRADPRGQYPRAHHVLHLPRALLHDEVLRDPRGRTHRPRHRHREPAAIADRRKGDGHDPHAQGHGGQISDDGHPERPDQKDAAGRVCQPAQERPHRHHPAGGRRPGGRGTDQRRQRAADGHPSGPRHPL